LQSVLFHDRVDAANNLAESLLLIVHKKSQMDSLDSLVVLAIPRGGVVIGDVIATKLNAKLDIIVSRKIGAPYNQEFAIGAVMPDGTYFLNDDSGLTPQSYIDNQVNVKVKEIEHRLMNFRGSSEYGDKLKGKIVILVDDGIATGATILSAAKWIREKQNCQKLIIAVPVGPRDTVNKLKEIIEDTDDIIVLHSPDPFIAVGRFYRNFEQTGDDEVKSIMKRHGYNSKFQT